MSQVARTQALVSFVEWQALYRDPDFELWSRASAIVSAVFGAFRPWGIGLANVSGRQNPANASEAALLFNLLNGKVVFSVGVGAASLLANNPTWSDEKEISLIAEAGLQAVQGAAGVVVRQQVLSLTVHLKPQERSIREISADFLNVKSPKISSQPIKARGFSIYGDDFSWVVDSSALFQGALFVKIIRNFEPSVSFSSLAEALRSDQSELLAALQLSVD